ncbi:MAG: flagellar motor stator protein MotA [Alphaproteobacteria bacterium]|nr:flagellar motor stator protein MotA [Alphaproteobacteria bacterium]
MNFIAGVLIAVVCTIGGFVAEGGHLKVLADSAPIEILIMGGTAAAGFIIGNPKVVIMRTLRSMKLLFQGPRFGKESYVELLSFMYQMFRLAKTKGMLSLESHIEKPEESSIFAAFPGFMKEEHALVFFCDYARLMTLGSDKPFEIEALMDEELEVHHNEQNAVVAAVLAVADSMPAIGIVAAVLGVIHTMGAITEPPEVLGRLIGGALVGTFMGVWTGYAFIGPMGRSLEQRFAADSRYFQCLKVGMLAHLQGFAPAISIEYARKALQTDVRPSFTEVEEATQALSAPT